MLNAVPMLRTLNRNGRAPSLLSGNAAVTDSPISEGSEASLEERVVLASIFEGRVGCVPIQSYER